MDHFEVFGLPRRLGIDAAQLQRAFYELSRRSHPDFHQAAPPERQAEILEASARLASCASLLTSNLCSQRSGVAARWPAPADHS